MGLKNLKISWRWSLRQFCKPTKKNKHPREFQERFTWQLKPLLAVLMSALGLPWVRPWTIYSIVTFVYIWYYNLFELFTLKFLYSEMRVGQQKLPFKFPEASEERKAFIQVKSDGFEGNFYKKMNCFCLFFYRFNKHLANYVIQIII